MRRVALALLVACSSAPPPKPPPKSFGMCRAGPNVPVAREEMPPPIDRMARSRLGSRARCASRGEKGVFCWGKDEVLFGGTEVHGPTLVKDFGQTDHVTNGSPSCSIRGGDVMCLAEPDAKHRRGLSRKLGDAIELASGGGSVCAIHRSGETECWGEGYREPIALPADAISIAMGAHGQTCVARKSGGVTCWGELDDHAYTSTHDVKGVDDAVAVAVSTQRPGFFCALLRTGAVTCWGQAGYGELGKGRNGVDRPPAIVHGISEARSLALGGHHACVVTRNARVFCWGMNDAGQLGDGSTTNHDEPLGVADIEDAVSVACGERHTCVERANGAVSCFGDDREGELGGGRAAEGETPFSVAPLAVGGLP